MKCNQTGKVFKVKVAALTRCDDSNMTMEDLAEGSQLLMVMNKKSYPITVQKVISALDEVSTVGRMILHLLKIVASYNSGTQP